MRQGAPSAGSSTGPEQNGLGIGQSTTFEHVDASRGVNGDSIDAPKTCEDDYLGQEPAFRACGTVEQNGAGGHDRHQASARTAVAVV